MKTKLIRSILIPLFTICTINLAGQSITIKLIQKGEYLKAEEKISKALAKDSVDVEQNYNMSVLCSERGYQGYQPTKAYAYLMKSKQIFDLNKDEKESKKMAKIPLTKEIIETLLDSICSRAKTDALNKNNIIDYENYLNTFIHAPLAYTNEITTQRNELAFKLASDTNTISSYQNFIIKYNLATQIAEAITKRNALAFERAKREDKISAYKEFINQYNQAEELAKAWERIYELAFAEAQKTNNSASYKKFMDEYPNNFLSEKAFAYFEKCQFNENIKSGDWLSFKNFILQFPDNSLISAAQDSIYDIAIKTQQLDALAYCLEKMTGTKRNLALSLYHDIFTMDGEKFSLDMFYQKYDNETLKDTKIKDYELLQMGDSILSQSTYDISSFIKFDRYIRLAAPRDRAFSALQKMITPYIENKNWKEALNTIMSYKPFFGDKNKKYNDLVLFLQAQ